MAECLSESMENSTLQVELEILESIYLDELLVEQDDSGCPSKVEITLHPATADNVEAQFVRLTLSIKLPKEYPQKLPSLAIQNPRGLSEQQVNSLYKSLQQLAQEREGESMLYEIIELAKDSLTHNNLPSCECAICLYPFHEMDDFTKTECYHYFHCHCLGRYIQHTLDQEPEVTGPVDPGRVETPENEVVCPMCREPISYDLAGLLSAKPPAINEDKYRPDEAMVRWQSDMAEVYKKQQSQGGIIDIEAEKNKFFIKLETPRQEEDVPLDLPPIGTELSQGDAASGDMEGGTTGTGIMAPIKAGGLRKTSVGDVRTTGTVLTKTTQASGMDRKTQSAGIVSQNEDGKRKGISGGMEKDQRKQEGERRVRSAGTGRGYGRYHGRRHSPRDGWRDRSKGGERRQYREGRKSPRDGERVKKEGEEPQNRGNEEGKHLEKRALNKEHAGRRGEQESRETKRKDDEKKAKDVAKSQQSTSLVAGNTNSDQLTKSDRPRDEVPYQPITSLPHKHGDEADKRKDISTKDEVPSRELPGKTFKNGFLEPRDDHRSSTSISTKQKGERYRHQQHKGREGDDIGRKRTPNHTRQRECYPRNHSNLEGRRGSGETKKERSDTVLEKRQTHVGIGNEKEDRKWNKSEQSTGREGTGESRNVTGEKRHDRRARGPPPGFQKGNVKKNFTRPPPGFDDVR